MDPGAGGTRFVSEIRCRSDDPRLSEAAACRLAPIQRLIGAGQWEAARAALHRFADDPGISDGERYIAARLQYTIAAADAQDEDRAEALRAMLATAAMPAAERLQALRTLVSLALRGGDSEGAAALIEELLLLAPEDTRSLVNLASLRAGAGRGEEAAALVRRAIGIAERRGEAVPAEWLSFAAAPPPAAAR
jgi:hypothetical protein